MRRLLALLLFLPSSLTALTLKDNDRIVLLGDALFEAERPTGALELELHRRHPQLTLSLRNLSWSGDTPAGLSRASFGKAEEGRDRLREHLVLAQPTVVVLGYGMAACLQELTDRANDWSLNPDPERYGTMSVERFSSEMEELIALIREVNGEETRLAIVSPVPHEDLRGTRPGLPDPGDHNNLLTTYSAALRSLAEKHGASWVDSAAALAGVNRPHTTNGIHLTKASYAKLAGHWCDQLGWPAAPAPPAPALLPAILDKSDAFFHRYRPANATYLFGFRKREQGQNAKEMEEWDKFLAVADQRIDALKRGNTPPPLPAPAPQVDEDPELPDPDFTLPDGYEISLWAEAPLVRKPVAMHWDRGGQLWVAGTPIYPQIQPGRKPEDTISLLADADGDGKADRSTVFADDLLIPTGVAPVLRDDGVPSTACYVGASTELLLLEDTDGDGKADRRRVVFGGFGTEDTHHNVHTLKWGPDGRLYFNQSIYTHSHLETPHGMVRLNSGGSFAYDPETERVEVFMRGFWNAWGHDWNRDGQSFFTDGAGFSGLGWAFPGTIFATSEGAERTMPTVSPGRYPKYAGLLLLDSPVFPDDWQGDAITCDFRAHRIVRFEIEDLEQQDPKRSGYVTRELPPLVVTNDVAFRPIEVTHGPDGALYVADWTNPIINHGEVDFRDPRRDRTNGRIWRITRTGAPAVDWKPTARAVARSGDPVREASSDSPRRRIEAMRALARQPDRRSVETILLTATNCPPEDPYYEFAAWRSIRDVADEWVALVEEGEWAIGTTETRAATEFALRSIPAELAHRALVGLLEQGAGTAVGRAPWNTWIGDYGRKPELQRVFDALAQGDPETPEDRSATIRALLAAQKRGIRPDKVEELPASFFLPATPDSLRLIAAWKRPFEAVIEGQLDQPGELRTAAFEALGQLRTADAILILTKQLSRPDPDLRRQGLATLAAFKPDLALQALPAIAPELGADPAFWRPLLAHNGFLQQFAKAVPAGWEPSLYQAALTAARETGRRGGALVKALQPLAGQEPTAAPEGRKSVAGIVKDAETGGDPAVGELIYRRPELTCTLCHAIGGVGGKLGPDMTSLGASAPLDYIVESLLHPERKVKEGYHGMAYTLTDGNTAVGIPTRSTATEQFIQTVVGEQGIPKEQIKAKAIAGAGGSLMPAGLINALDRRETRNLVSFLAQLGKPGPFDASDGGVARLWTIRPATETATALAGEPGGTPLPTLVDGRLTPALLKPLLGDQGAVLATTRFVTTTDGKVSLKFEGIAEAWVNGDQLPVASEPGRTLDLKAGTHTLTIRLSADALPTHVRASSPEARFLTE